MRSYRNDQVPTRAACAIENGNLHGIITEG